MNINNKILFLIFVTSFFLRIIFLSDWLEDWDSVQFAMALKDFDIGSNIPHAPGYPIYILLGKILHFFVGNDTLSLTLLSAILGSFSVVLIFLLARSMFDEKTAIISSIFSIFIPIHFLMSVSALTNIPGLFSLTFFAYLLYKLKGKKIIFLSFLGGLILGMRFTEIPIIIALLAITIIKYKKYNLIFPIFFSFIAGCFSWIFPMIAVSGIDSFISSYKWITLYVLKHDSLTGSAYASLSDRIKRIQSLLIFGYTSIFTIAALLATLLSIKKTKTSFAHQFLFVWLFSYLFVLIFFYNLELTRYTLPLVVPSVILVSESLVNFTRSRLKHLSYLIFLFLLLFLVKETFSQIRIYNIIPPSIAPVKYVKNNFSSKDTIIIGSYIFRQFEYYAPEFSSFYTEQIKEEDLKHIKYVVMDYSGLVEKLPKNTSYKIISTKDFLGDNKIHTRIPKITLTVIELK